MVRSAHGRRQQRELPLGTDRSRSQIDYEERITLWRTESAEAAIALAEDESRRYVEDLGGDVLELSQSYALAMKPGHGVKVFSLIRRSKLLPDQYLDRHFDTGTEHQTTAG